MDEAKLEALKNRRMKGIDVQISVKPSKDSDLAPGAPEQEEEDKDETGEPIEGSMADYKEDVAEGEMPDVGAPMQAAIKQHEADDKTQDEATFRKMLDETGFQKKFGKKVG